MDTNLRETIPIDMKNVHCLVYEVYQKLKTVVEILEMMKTNKKLKKQEIFGISHLNYILIEFDKASRNLNISNSPRNQREYMKLCRKWNFRSNTFRSNLCPFIGNHLKSDNQSKSKPKRKIMDKGEDNQIYMCDTLMDDVVDYGEKVHIICCHSKRNICSQLTKETITSMITFSLDDSTKWDLIKYMSHVSQKMYNILKPASTASFESWCKYIRKKIISILVLKCQQVPKDTCPSMVFYNTTDFKSKPPALCGSPIKLSNLLAIYTPKEREDLAPTDKLYKLLMNVFKNFNATTSQSVKNLCYGLSNFDIYYCRNVKCILSEWGFFIGCDTISKDNANIFCKTCNKQHTVHYHGIYCRMCNTSFCEICEISPYHEDDVCQGKLSNDLDEETKKYLLKNTRQCPTKSCGERVERISGCDHMICPNCKVDFCFRCLQTLNKDNPYGHECLPKNIVKGSRNWAFDPDTVHVNVEELRDDGTESVD